MLFKNPSIRIISDIKQNIQSITSFNELLSKVLVKNNRILLD